MKDGINSKGARITANPYANSLLTITEVSQVMAHLHNLT